MAIFILVKQKNRGFKMLITARIVISCLDDTDTLIANYCLFYWIGELNNLVNKIYFDQLEKINRSR